jgi:TM2 domain-containing membrane protein YozV
MPKTVKQAAPVVKQPGPGRKDKKWIVALILSILVGGLGVDRFYMGYIGTGILKLITFGGLGIWWLIDLILIATKHDFAKVNWVE